MCLYVLYKVLYRFYICFKYVLYRFYIGFTYVSIGVVYIYIYTICFRTDGGRSRRATQPGYKVRAGPSPGSGP